MPFPSDIETLAPADQALAQQFSNVYHRAVDHIESHHYDKAREDYLDLLQLYQDLRAKNLDPIHTHIAFSCIEDLYNDLQQHIDTPVVSSHGIQMGICVSVLLVLLGVYVILNPSFVGLSVYEPELGATWIGPEELVIDGTTTLDLDQYTGSHDLLYLATRGIGLEVYLDGPLLTIIPNEHFKGKSLLTLYGYTTGDTPTLALQKYLTLHVR